MRRLISIALVLTMLTTLLCPVAQAASTPEEALGNVDIYSGGYAMSYLAVNGKVQKQEYTYFPYRSETTGEVKEIPAYCVNPNLYGVPQTVGKGESIEYLADEKASDPKVVGIIANCYPHRGLVELGLDSAHQAFYAGKIALWCYLIPEWDISKVTVNPNLTGDELERAQRLLEAVKKIYTAGMAWDHVPTPQLTTVADQETAYPVTVDGKAYYQQIFTLTSDTWVCNYAVEIAFQTPGTVPQGTRITDLDNKDITVVTTGNDKGIYTGQFKVLYPAESIEGKTGSVQFALSADVYKYAVFYAICQETDEYGSLQNYLCDTDPQTAILRSGVSKYASTATPTPTPDTPTSPTPTPGTPSEPEPSELEIIKYEQGTEIPLAGASFEVKGPNGDVIGVFTTGPNGKATVPAKEAGSYTVREVDPPKYHLLDDEPTKTVTVRPGETARLTFHNQPYGDLRIEKVDGATGSSLAGARIQIKHIESGATYTGETSTGGSYTFTELLPGAYEIVELAAPEGWKRDPQTHTTTVVTGQCVSYTLKNDALPGLKITKYDSQTHTTMSGVTFEIFKDTVSLGRYETDAMGEILLTNLQPGTYRVVEVDTGNTTHIIAPPQEVELTTGGGIKELIFLNDQKPGMWLVKVDSADPSKVIPNAVFVIRAVDGSFGPKEFTTDRNGEIDLSALPVGSYEVVEKSCEGYIIDQAQRIIHLEANQTARFVFTNTIKPSLNLIKLSSDGSRLEGVTFRIAKIEDGTHYLDRTTNAQGEILISDLEPGVYSVRETATLSNHIMDLREYHVELFPGKTSTLVIENHRRPNLTICKRDADTGEPIPNTVFLVKAADGHSVNEVKTGADGKAVLENLLPGVYEVSEKSVPAPWLTDAPPQLVTLYPNRDRAVYFENYKKPTLTINKVDSITGSPIKGAKFEVWYGSNNTTTGELNSLGTFFSDENGQIVIDNLRDGWYKVTELEPAAGFTIKEPATQEFYIKGGESKTITYENVPLNAIIIEKYDSVTGEALPGCTFQLKYLGGTSGTGGTVIGTKVTGKNGTAIWTGLKPGTYIAEEVDPADGYSIIQSSETIFLADSGEQSVVTVRFANAPDGTLLIRKVCATNPSVTLQNAEFKVVYSDGTLIGDSNGIFRTDEAGEIRITGLKPGKSVVVTETRAPSGFLIDTQSQTIQIKAGRTVTLTFKNQPKGQLIIQKRDSATNQPLPGAEFRVTTAAGCEVGLNGVIGTSTLTSNGIFTTDAQGEIKITNLAPGAYVLSEIKAPPGGYVIDTPSTNVVIGTGGDTQTVVVKNSKAGSLIILKKDSHTGKPLAGVTFKVTTSTGEFVPDANGYISSNGLYVTDKEGKITINGVVGTLVVSETKSIPGYTIDPATQTQTVQVNPNDTQTLTFYNTPSTTLVIEKYADTGTSADNAVPLKGVTFLVMDSSGAVVGQSNGEFVTDESGKIVIDNLTPGTTITAREIKTVEGYVLDGAPKSILIKEGEVQTLRFYNKRAGTLVIRKLDKLTGKPLAGVEFELTYAEGGYVDAANGHLSSKGLYTTDARGEIRISGITGTIVVKETRPLPGYTIDPATQTQTVTVNPADTQTITFYNIPGQTLTIQKLVTGTKDRPLAGVEFLIIDSSGAFVGPNNGIYKTDKNGRITLTGLEPGTVITAKETKSLEGFVLDSTPQSIEIKSGEAQILTFYNTPSGGVEIIKVNEADKSERIPNVTFEIRRVSDQGLVKTVTTDKKGRVYAELDAGNYYAVETECPKEFKCDPTPHYFTVTDGKNTTLTVTNKPFSGIILHKIDSMTGEGIYNVKFLVYDQDKNPIGEYSTDNRGYIYIDDMTVQGKGRLYIRELEAAPGYELDKEYKTVYLQPGKTIELEWKNVPITGQFQIYKYAAAYNEVTGTPAGAPLQGAVYEISEARSGKVVDYVTTDARGVAASKPLPLGRYKIVEVTAPAYWQVSGVTFDETLEYSGQIIKVSDYDKPSNLGVSIIKRGNAEALAGSQMRYNFTVANTSNVPLSDFYWHDRIPTDAARATVFTTGTYSARLNYRILYKTNCAGTYQVLASNLLTSSNYSFSLNAIPTQPGEYVTDIYLDFGKVPVGFQSTSNPTLTVQILGTVANGYQIINRADVGGKYQSTWQTAQTSWVTTVRKLTPTPTLPKTGY